MRYIANASSKEWDINKDASIRYLEIAIRTNWRELQGYKYSESPPLYAKSMAPNKLDVSRGAKRQSSYNGIVLSSWNTLHVTAPLMVPLAKHTARNLMQSTTCRGSDWSTVSWPRRWPHAPSRTSSRINGHASTATVDERAVARTTVAADTVRVYRQV